MASLLQPLQQLVQEHHLAGGDDDAVHCASIHLLAAELLLGRLEQEGVVAAPVKGGGREYTSGGDACGIELVILLPQN